MVRIAMAAMITLLAPMANGAESNPSVRSVDSVTITVSNVAKATDFYTGVLGFTRVADYEVAGSDYEHLYGVFGLRVRIARLSLGEETIELMQFLVPRGRPIPVDSHSNDRWFQHVAIIVRDMDLAYARLREFGVAYASPAPQTLPDWNPNAGGIKAFYFQDPDGNNLEILQFPPGKGDPKWQRSGTALFLGIDHTAIVVTNTDASLAFYRDLLGMTVAGHSENYGPEQERLNNVFGARLLITALRAADGPGIELLEYLAPRDGRPMPSDTRANDLWYWAVNYCGNAMLPADAPIPPVPVPDGALGFDAARPIKDPDGHAGFIMQAGGSRCPFQ
jgi:catechol 2,3-dioxygenase-like lactoylglutathione lyase family enzyme